MVFTTYVDYFRYYYLYNIMNDVTPLDYINPRKPRASQETIDQRLEICRSCEFFKHGSQRCKKCGCFMKLKTELEQARCPIGKW